MQRYLGAVAGLTLAAAAIAAPAQAQNVSDARTVRFGVQGGLSMPTGDFGDVAEMGFLIGGMMDIRPATLPVDFRIDLAYNRWGLDDGGLDLDGSFSGLSLGGNVVVAIPTEGTVGPYVLGGLGMYRTTIEVEDEDESETDLGMQLGGGLNFRLSGFETFVEARYHKIFGDTDADFLPIVFGIRF